MPALSLCLLRERGEPDRREVGDGAARTAKLLDALLLLDPVHEYHPFLEVIMLEADDVPVLVAMAVVGAGRLHSNPSTPHSSAR